jgi:hypothetical protein
MKESRACREHELRELRTLNSTEVTVIGLRSIDLAPTYRQSSTSVTAPPGLTVPFAVPDGFPV